MVAAGSRLGPYEVVSRLGAGGMGEVWRANDTRLDRPVAVKILPPEFAENGQLKVRFEREAKLVSSLNHPNICTLHDVGESDGVHYLVMELLEGETLAERLTRGALPLEQALAIGSQIAAALDKAHRQGIVHRDLKPANIMLTKSGAKLLDFGLAKSREVVVLSHPSSDAAFENDATRQKALTQEGTILGTFQYMSPEQLEGADADPRSDIFAFGAVLYEIVTGRRAFAGKTKTSLIAAIVQGRPAPVSQLQPLTPPALERLIESCLEKDPEDRIQTAHDVLLQLRWIAEGGSEAGIAAPVVKRRRLHERLRWIAALLLVAAAGTFVGWRFLPRDEARASYSFTIPASDGVYRAGTGRISAAVISPDGTRVYFFANDNERKLHLWTRRLDSLEAKRLVAIEGAAFAKWWPDSRSILFHSGGRLLRIPAEGGPAQPIGELPRLSFFAVSPDGTIIVSQTEGPLSRIDSRTGATTVITSLDKRAHENAHLHPEFLPDGRRFLFIATTRDPSRSDDVHRLYAGSLDSRETRFLREISSEVRYAEPGLLLFVRDGVLLAQKFDADKLEFIGEPQTVVEDVFYFKPTGLAGFSLSANGVLAVGAPVRAARLHMVTADGRERTPIGKPASFGSLAVAPDGERILISLSDPRLGTHDLWIQGLDRGTAQRLTFDSGWESQAVWSPDGLRVYYASDQMGVPDLYEKVIDGSGEDKLVLAANNTQFPRDVSPDGKFLLYQTSEDPGTLGDLYVVSLEGERKGRPFVKLPLGQGASAQFSPDGRFVAYSSGESGASQIYTKPFPGPGPARQISTSGGAHVRWSPDGRYLYFINDREMMSAEIAQNNGATLGEPRVLFDLDHEVVAFDLTADGKHFLIIMNTEADATPPTRVYVNWQRLLKGDA